MGEITIDDKIEKFFIDWERGYASAYDAVDLLKELHPVIFDKVQAKIIKKTEKDG